MFNLKETIFYELNEAVYNRHNAEPEALLKTLYEYTFDCMNNNYEKCSLEYKYPTLEELVDKDKFLNNYYNNIFIS